MCDAIVRQLFLTHKLGVANPVLMPFRAATLPPLCYWITQCIVRRGLLAFLMATRLTNADTALQWLQMHVPSAIEFYAAHGQWHTVAGLARAYGIARAATHAVHEAQEEQQIAINPLPELKFSRSTAVVPPFPWELMDRSEPPRFDRQVQALGMFPLIYGYLVANAADDAKATLAVKSSTQSGATLVVAPVTYPQLLIAMGAVLRDS